MTLQPVTRIVASLPEPPLKTSPQTGYALCAESAKKIFPRRSNKDFVFIMETAPAAYLSGLLSLQ